MRGLHPAGEQVRVRSALRDHGPVQGPSPGEHHVSLDQGPPLQREEPVRGLGERREVVHDVVGEPPGPKGEGHVERQRRVEPDIGCLTEALGREQTGEHVGVALGAGHGEARELRPGLGGRDDQPHPGQPVALLGAQLRARHLPGHRLLDEPGARPRRAPPARHPRHKVLGPLPDPVPVQVGQHHQVGVVSASRPGLVHRSPSGADRGWGASPATVAGTSRWAGRVLPPAARCRSSCRGCRASDPQRLRLSHRDQASGGHSPSGGCRTGQHVARPPVPGSGGRAARQLDGSADSRRVHRPDPRAGGPALGRPEAVPPSAHGQALSSTSTVRSVAAPSSRWP